MPEQSMLGGGRNSCACPTSLSQQLFQQTEKCVEIHEVAWVAGVGTNSQRTCKIGATFFHTIGNDNVAFI